MSQNLFCLCLVFSGLMEERGGRALEKNEVWIGIADSKRYQIRSSKNYGEKVHTKRDAVLSCCFSALGA